jgi:4-diphosphocytidyl-2-C-methyl-D-erythritol kinase
MSSKQPEPMMVSEISTRAPAKVNLGLSVLGRRADGFHDILSVFQAISWYDEIRLMPNDRQLEMECSDPDLPTGPGNLAWRAAEAAKERFGIDSGVTIHLEKRIPVGAGLGGGSSDAAAVLRGLAQMWSIDAEEDEWLDVCAEIGSDVPFFWRGGTAVVSGRGEVVDWLPSQKSLTLVVALPTVRVATAWAYGQLSQPFPDSSAYRRRVEALATGSIDLPTLCEKIGNDFQEPIEDVHPEIGRLRIDMLEAGARTSLMSGSGSAVFGVFEDGAAAESAADRLGTDAMVVTTMGAT